MDLDDCYFLKSLKVNLFCKEFFTCDIRIKVKVQIGKFWKSILYSKKGIYMKILFFQIIEQEFSWKLHF